MTLSGSTSKLAPLLRLACRQNNEALVVAFKKGLAAKISTSIVQDELEVRTRKAALLCSASK